MNSTFKRCVHLFNLISGCEARKVVVAPTGQEDRRFAQCSCPSGARRGGQRRPEGAVRARLKYAVKFAHAVDGRRVPDHQPRAEADRSEVLLLFVRFGHLRIGVPYNLSVLLHRTQCNSPFICMFQYKEFQRGGCLKRPYYPTTTMAGRAVSSTL